MNAAQQVVEEDPIYHERGRRRYLSGLGPILAVS